FGVSLTGGLASSGKAHLMSKQIWAEEINAKGGLLGRPIKLVYYDDQTNAATVPGIYAKLIDVDKVDLLMGHATNLIVAAMPLIIERKKLVMVLLALGSNAEFKYPRYFQSAAFGPDSKGVLSNNFFAVAKSLAPEPKTVALVGADAEFSNNVLIGARENAKKYGLKIVYDRSYPPATVDYTPIVRAIQATSPDVVLVASYPPDSVGIVRAATEIGLKNPIVRRGNGRNAIRVAHAAAGRKAQPRRELPSLRPKRQNEFPRHRGVPEEVSGAGQGGRHRPARLLPAALRLCRDAGAGAGNQGDRQSQRRQACRLHSQQRIQHDRRRNPLQRTRRMSAGTDAGGAVSERSRQRARSVHDRSQAGHPLSPRVQGWRTRGSVREIANEGLQ